MSFAKIAKELRDESGLSQMELSKKIGISAAAIGFLELGKHEPNAATIVAYSKYFDVSTDYLLGLEDDFGIRTIAPVGDTYTTEERELIEDYRQLNYYKQELIRNNIKAMLPTEAESTQKKKETKI